MKHQDLKTLTSKAVDRAMGAREAAGVELTDEQVASVSGGLAYIKDPTWYGIWEHLKNVQLPSQIDVGVAIDAGRLDANVGVKVAF